MSLASCLLIHAKQLQDFDTSVIREMTQGYIAGGMSPLDAARRAVDDKLAELKVERRRIERDVLAQYRELRPELFEAERAIQIEAVPKSPPTGEYGEVREAGPDGVLAPRYVEAGAGNVQYSLQSIRQRAVGAIREVLARMRTSLASSVRADILLVSPESIAEAARYDIDLTGYAHMIDGSAVKHALDHHGDAAAEKARGLIAIADTDFELIPTVLESPDKTIYGMRNKRGQPLIGYLKFLEDGTTLYVEEVRTGAMRLAMTSMRKYPATRDVPSILKSVPLYVRNDGGSTALSVVDAPAVRNFSRAVTRGLRQADGAVVGTVAGDRNATGVRAGNGLSVAAVEKALSPLFKLFPRLAGVITVVQSADDIEGGAVAANARGVYFSDSKRIYLVADNIGSIGDVTETVYHEGVGHLAIEELLEAVAPGLYTKLLRQVSLLDRGGNKLVRQIADEVRETYSQPLKTPELEELRRVAKENGVTVLQVETVAPLLRRLAKRTELNAEAREMLRLAQPVKLTDHQVAAEVLAILAERRLHHGELFSGPIRTILDKFVEALRALARLVLDRPISDRDVLALLRAAEWYLAGPAISGEAAGPTVKASTQRDKALFARRPAAGEGSAAEKRARASDEKVVEKYVSGLHRFNTPTGKPHNQFEIEKTGRYNYRVILKKRIRGRNTIDIDGYRGRTLLEAKFVRKPKNSLYISGSKAPSFLYVNVLGKQDGEFRRLKAAIDDPTIPFNRLEVLVNDCKAVPYFSTLMRKYKIPGEVMVVATKIPQILSRSK